MKMSKQEREIRLLLRKSEDIHCLDEEAYICTLAVALRMPIGTVKAKILKPTQ